MLSSLSSISELSDRGGWGGGGGLIGGWALKTYFGGAGGGRLLEVGHLIE